MSEHRCVGCGTSAEAPADGIPLGWSSAVDGDVISELCASCTRHHVRDIEGKLDERWWA